MNAIELNTTVAIMVNAWIQMVAILVSAMTVTSVTPSHVMVRNNSIIILDRSSIFLDLLIKL